MELRDTAKAADGRELAVTRFPAEGAPWATLLVAGAMGVRQDFYEPLARFLAEHGIHVLTFDYRGMGASRTGPMAGVEADLTTWIEQDLASMLREARAPGPRLPAFALGHSLGGQILGATAESAALRAIVTVTAGNGWYRHNDRMPLRVRIFWFVAIPLLTPLFGYFPGRRVRLVGDLPRGVAWQWRRWCLHRDYLLREGPAMRERFGGVRAPILGWSFEDDPLITKRAIDELHGFYARARIERRHVVPPVPGRARIGHFGYFDAASREGPWRETLAWLREVVAAKAGG